VPRAEALLDGMDARLAAVRAAAAHRPRQSAILYDANGFTVGRPGITDDIMTIAGLDNLAPSLGIGEYGTLPLETMIAARADHIVHLVYRPGVPSLADAIVSHPALKASLGGRPMLNVRGGLLNCATPLVAQAAEEIATELAP
jgi:iron complex transport system substrate-binding protein